MHYSVSFNFQKLIFHFFSVWHKLLKKLLNATKLWVILHNFTSWQWFWILYPFLQEPLKWKIHPCQEPSLLRQRLHNTIVTFSFKRRQKNQFTLYTSVKKFRALPLLKWQRIKIKFHAIKYMEKKTINISCQ